MVPGIPTGSLPGGGKLILGDCACWFQRAYGSPIARIALIVAGVHPMQDLGTRRFNTPPSRPAQRTTATQASSTTPTPQPASLPAKIRALLRPPPTAAGCAGPNPSPSRSRRCARCSPPNPPRPTPHSSPAASPRSWRPWSPSARPAPRSPGNMRCDGRLKGPPAWQRRTPLDSMHALSYIECIDCNYEVVMSWQ